MGCGASRSVTTIKQGNCSIPIRIMLIGKTGAGKSSLGNAMLGKPTFKTEGLSMDSTTIFCDTGSARIGDKDILLLDTPGVMGTSQEETQIMEELFKGASSLHPGPHVFLLVIRADAKFTKEESEAVNIFSDVFGEAMHNHLVVVFTHKSELDKSNKTKEDCLLRLPEIFQKFRESCIAIETGGKSNQVKTEVTKLLQVIEKVIQNNNGICYPDEKIKEIAKEYKARMEAQHGLREKGKEKFQEMTGHLYDKAVDTMKDMGQKVPGVLKNVTEKIFSAVRIF